MTDMYDSVSVSGNRLNIHVNSKNSRVYRLKVDTPASAASWREALVTHITAYLNAKAEESI
jgi:hypothetical protein